MKQLDISEAFDESHIIHQLNESQNIYFRITFLQIIYGIIYIKDYWYTNKYKKLMTQPKITKP